MSTLTQPRRHSAVFLFRQAGWATANQLVQVVLALAGLAAMTRVLGPESYGVYALGMIFVGLIEIATGSHAVDFLVQREDLHPGHENAAFVSLTAIGVLALIAGWTTAPLVAQLLGSPDVAIILPLLATLPLIGAVSNVPIVRLTRHLRFEAMARVDVAASVAAFVVGVGSAYSGLGLWSLPVMEVVRRLMRLTLACAAARWRPECSFTSRQFVDLWAFSRRRISAMSMVYVTTSAPRYLMGLFLGPTLLGYYVVASRLAEQLSGLLIYPLAAVAYPAAARLQDDLAQMRLLFAQAISIASSLIWPTVLGFVAVAPAAVALLLGEAWVGTTIVVQFLTLIAVKATVFAFCTPIFLSCGRPDIQTRLDFFDMVLTVSFILAGAPFGLVAVSCAIALKSFLFIPIVTWHIRPILDFSIRAQLAGIFASAIPASLMAFCVAFVPYLLPTVGVAVVLMAQVVVGVATYGVFWTLLNRRSVDVLLRSATALVRGDARGAAEVAPR